MLPLIPPTQAVVLQRSTRDKDKWLVLLTRDLGKVRALAKGSAVPSRWSGRLEPLVVLDASFARGRSGLLRLTSAGFVESLAEAFQSTGAARRLAPFIHLLVARFPHDYPDPLVYDAFIVVLRHLPESNYPEDLYWTFSGVVLSASGGLSPDCVPSLDRIPAIARSGLDPSARRDLIAAVTSGWKTALSLTEPGFRSS